MFISVHFVRVGPVPSPGGSRLTLFDVASPSLRVWTGKTGKDPHEHWSKHMFWSGKVAVRTAKAPVRFLVPSPRFSSFARVLNVRSQSQQRKRILHKAAKEAKETPSTLNVEPRISASPWPSATASAVWQKVFPAGFHEPRSADVKELENKKT